MQRGLPMAIPIAIVEAADLEQISLAPRAIVYLTVEWSVPERRTRQSFLRFVGGLPSSLQISSFIVSEDDEFAAEWLDAHTPYDKDCKSGSGGVAWFSHGTIVRWAFSAQLVDRHAVTIEAFDL